MNLSAARSFVLAIDVQDRLAPAIEDKEAVLERVRLLLAAARRLSVPVLATEQYPKGLGPTIGQLRETLEPKQIHEKITFSAFRTPSVRGALEHAGRDQAVVVGMEAHVCVLQTALDLHGAGWQTFVVADAVGSRTRASRDLALDRFRQAGLQVVNAEMAVFEWLERADTAAFRDLIRLIK